MTNTARLELPDWVGQRSASFRFELLDGVNDIHKGLLHPLADSPGTLTHDTTRTVKRQVSLDLGVQDAALIDPIRDRVLIFMTLGGVDYPLGRYMLTDHTRALWTSGELETISLTDEMFLVDQSLEAAFTANPLGTSSATVYDAIVRLLRDVPQIRYLIESTSLAGGGSWAAGTSRAQVLSDLAVQGGYFPPWFDNEGTLRLIQAFDPAQKISDFDLDAGNRVIRGSILNVDDLLNAPNRFVVISNGATGSDATQPVFGTYDVPSSAPHSIHNRGFVIADVRDIQLTSLIQADAVARSIGLANTIYQRVNLATAPDPRHDSYQVITWQGEKWLELSWSLTLTEGAPMQHLLRKVYS